MARTLAVYKLGPNIRMAWGTVADVSDASSFTVVDTGGGSQIMRNIINVQLTPMGTNIGGGSVQVQGRGSTDGYIHCNVTQHGSFTQPVVGGTIDVQFQAVGGMGSI